MREITSHKVNGLNDAIHIVAVDEPGAGGASHVYQMGLKSLTDPLASLSRQFDFQFQNGPITEAGINGISNEALLAVVVDRLECFQKGQYSCRENAIALTKLQEAMHWLHHRTRERVARGVEGTSQK